MNRPNTSDNLLDSKAKLLANTFAEQEGRRPRILLSHLEEDNQIQDIKVIASTYADLGFDVDLAPTFHSAKDLSKQAIENDVSALHLTSISKNSLSHILEITESLSQYGSEYILLVVDGSSLTAAECELISDNGVHIILKKNTLITEAAINILTFLIE